MLPLTKKAAKTPFLCNKIFIARILRAFAERRLTMRKNHARWIACLMCLILLVGLFDPTTLTAHATENAELTADDYPEYSIVTVSDMSQLRWRTPSPAISL